MLSYLLLKLIWWVIMGGILIVYATTAGFDSGVTMYMPFLRSEIDRRIVLNTSAPTWDGNLTWILFAGGGLFVIWPVLYSTAFSGMYAAMLMIVFSMFLRPPSYEYRNKIDSPLWRRSCDWGLFLSGVIPVFVFGVAMGNCYLGFPFSFNPHTFEMYWSGSFFDLLSPFALLSGLISVLMVLMHGSVYLQRRTEGHIRSLAFKVHCITAILLLIGFTISGFWLMTSLTGYQLISFAPEATLYPLQNVVQTGPGMWFQTYQIYPWKYLAPIAAYAGTIESVWAAYSGWRNTAFWSSCVALGGIVATGGATLFPFLMPSSTKPDQSITVWNAASSQYGLNIMFYIGIVVFTLILIYKLFAYHTIWGKKPVITEKDVEEQHHTFY